jgi:hypothetical protein
MDDIEFNLLKDAAKDTDQIASTASKYVKVRKLLADGSLAAEKEFRVSFRSIMDLMPPVYPTNGERDISNCCFLSARECPTNRID